MTAAVAVVTEDADIEKAENTQAVIQRDKHYVPALRQFVAVIAIQAAAFQPVGATMNPDHYRLFRRIVPRRPDIQCQAIFRADPGLAFFRL
ncbi:hypothetical protein D3C76_1473430 [compost metagenome]